MSPSSDRYSRRSLLRLVGGGGVLALAGCAAPFEGSPSFDSAYTTYLDQELLTSDAKSGDQPWATSLITDESRLQRQLRLEAIPEARANEWRNLDFSEFFLAVFSSPLAVLPQGELRRDVVRGAIEDSEFVFEVSMSECPPEVSEVESWAVQFLLVEQWSRNGDRAPKSVGVASDLLSKC